MSSAVCFTPSNVIQDGGNNKLVFKFPTSVQLKNASVAVQSLNVYYSWRNVTAALGNNSFSITIFPAYAFAQTFTIVIPDGAYEIADLNSYIKYYSQVNGLYLIDTTGTFQYFLSIAVNPTAYAVELKTFNFRPTSLPTGWTLPSNFPSPPGGSTPLSWNPVVTFPANFCSLLGFKPGFTTDSNVGNTLSGATPQEGTASGGSIACLSNNGAPNLQPNSSVLVSLVGVANKFSQAPIIYSFSSGGSAVGALISERPSALAFVKIADGTYSEFRVTLLGSDLTPLPMLDPSISMVLLIKED